MLFSLPLAALLAIGVSGKSVELFGASQPTILVFVRTDCPISNRYAPELNRLYQQYSSRAAFYLVYPDRSESADAIRHHVAEYSYAFTPLRDPDGALARLSRATVTPEAAVFSPHGELLYHGRIDDLYVELGKSRREPTTHDLEDALRAVLDGKPVKNPATRALGCFLADIQ